VSEQADRRFRVGLTQWRATLDMAANLATAVELIDAAGADGADLALLPENGLSLGTNADMRAAALSVRSAEIESLQEAARRAGAAVVLGGFKRVSDDGTVYNTALAIGSDGELAGHYDKIHLFDARVGGQTFQASNVEQAGQCPVLLDVRGVRVGLTICYDVRFPELYRRLALEGAEVLLVPAAFTQTTGEAHWEVLLRARAVENAAFVVASATVRGDDGADAWETYGHALVVDPWGKVLADLGERQRAVEVVELDLGEVARVRDQMPVLRGTRPDAYAAEPQSLTIV
jgi:predicted amidohydrolase